MTMETDLVNEFLARKMQEKKDRDMRLIADLIMYAGVGIAVLALLDLMLKAG